MKKRKLVLALLVLTLGVAVYLNWQFGDGSGNLTETGSSSTDEILGNAELVNSTTEAKSKESKNKEKNYFSEARTNRENARKESLAELKEIIDNVKLSEEQKSQAIAQTAELSKRVENEANIENTVKAKGFDDCVAIIGDKEINIVVSGDKLSSAQTTQIMEIVKSATDVDSSAVKIVTAK